MTVYKDDQWLYKDHQWLYINDATDKVCIFAGLIRETLRRWSGSHRGHRGQRSQSPVTSCSLLDLLYFIGLWYLEIWPLFWRFQHEFTAEEPLSHKPLHYDRIQTSHVCICSEKKPGRKRVQLQRFPQGWRVPLGAWGDFIVLQVEAFLFVRREERKFNSPNRQEEDYTWRLHVKITREDYTWRLHVKITRDHVSGSAAFREPVVISSREKQNKTDQEMEEGSAESGASNIRLKQQLDVFRDDLWPLSPGRWRFLFFLFSSFITVVNSV